MENNNINTNNPNNQQGAITLNDIVRVIKKNWIIMAIITAVIFVLGAVYTLGIKKPTYKAVSILKVEVPLTSESSSEVGNSVNASLKYVQSVAEKVKHGSTIKRVSTDHSNIITDEQLDKETTTKYSTNSIFVTITVEDKNGDNAVVLANALATEVARYSKDTKDTSVTEDQKMICTISVADQAYKFEYASPNKILYLIVSLIIGVVASLIVVFLKEFASTKFKTPDEVETLGIPVLNTLPDDKTKNKDDSNSLITPSVKNFEPYNRLISNIKYSNVDNPYRTIMFTSSVMNELKTTVASNFALTLVHNEKKVVIVDLDTRKPRLHKVFQSSKENGIVEYLDGSITKKELIKHTEHKVDIITVGKNVVNPITLLESNKLKALIDELKEEYDYVIIDTPPLMACNDATIIARLVDGVVFNVAINQGKKKEVKAAVSQLLEADANIIGINITKASVKDRGGYYYYYYYDYGDKK